MTVVDRGVPRWRLLALLVSILVLVDDGRRRSSVGLEGGMYRGFNPCSCG